MNSSSATPRLSVGEKVAYGLGDTASNFFFQAFNLFLVYYYTDVFGLSPAAVGTMMLFTRCLDAVMDPIMGAIADRTQTRWGKYRPYLLWIALPYGVIGYLMFSNPALSPAGKLLFAYITYSLMWVAYTAINIPYSALMGVMSSSSEDRTSLSTFRFALAFTGSFLISSAVLPLKNWLGGLAAGHSAVVSAANGSALLTAPAIDQAAGFKYTMAIFAVVSVVLFLITFAKTKERVRQPVEQKNSLKADLKDLRNNKPWLVLFIVAFFTLANTGVRNATTLYFFKYNVGDESKATVFLSAAALAFVFGALATKLFLKLTDRRRLMIYLTLINAAAMASFYFIDPKQTTLMLVINTIGTFVVGPTPAIVWSLYADTADYGEWKFGRRSTALVFSAAVFAQKVGLAVGSSMLGWALKASHFVPNVAQTPEALQSILLLFTLVPGAFAVASGIAIIFYPLDDPRVRQIESDLRARKGEVPAEAAA
jgi:GPH family glycoside/pentoside/hexuronide:cation symporter